MVRQSPQCHCASKISTNLDFCVRTLLTVTALCFQFSELKKSKCHRRAGKRQIRTQTARATEMTATKHHSLRYLCTRQVCLLASRILLRSCLAIDQWILAFWWYVPKRVKRDFWGGLFRGLLCSVLKPPLLTLLDISPLFLVPITLSTNPDSSYPIARSVRAKELNLAKSRRPFFFLPFCTCVSACPALTHSNR